MNKLIKGSIAGAAGIALLLGGAGTLASWNDTASIAGGTIVAGNLAIGTSTTAATWTINGGTPRADLTGYKAVPGDVIVYTKPVSITATGDNLVATLSLGAGSITATSSSTAADVALANYLTKSATLTATGAGIAASGSNFTVTAGTAGVAQDVTVKVTITFPKNAAAGFENNTKTGSVSLAGLGITLTQN